MATRNITLPDTIYEKLRAIAKEKGLSIAAIIKIACGEYVERHEK